MSRKMVLILLGLLLCFVVRDAAALPLQMFSPGDPVIRDLRFLLREQGHSLTSLTPPVSSYEVKLMLDYIDEENLSDAGRDAYKRIQKSLHPVMRISERFLGVDAHIQSALQGRIRSNTAVDWTNGSGGTNPSWSEFNVPSLVKLYLNLYLADMFVLSAEPGVGADQTLMDVESRFFAHNVPPNFDYVDANSPFRAFGAAGGPWWSLQVGRDKVSFGSGNTGNLTISDNPDYYDFVRLALFSPNFKYSFFIGNFPLSDGVNSGHQLFPNGSELPQHDIHDTTERYFFLHRTDFRLFKVLSINLSEGVMAGIDGLSLRYLNPFMIYHSFYSWNDYPQWRNDREKSSMTGSLLAVELEWAIIPCLSVHGQFVMNEVAFPNELGDPDTLVPNAMGFLAGIEYVRAVKNWAAHFYLEGVYTDPYLYMLSSPFASFISMRRLSQSVKPEHGPEQAYIHEKLRYQWIGYAEGRDLMLIALGAVLYNDTLRFSFETSFARKGEHDIHWDWRQGKDAFDEKSPTGTPVNRLLFSLEANWQAARFLCVGAYIAQTVLWNANHEHGRFESGGEISLAVSFTY